MREGFDERSAGGIVYRVDGGKVWWLVIKTSSKRRLARVNDGNRTNERMVYKFPKGHLLKNEYLKKAAVREVEEEGRVKAAIVGKIGSRNYIITDKLAKRKIVKKVTFFLMKYLDESKLRHFDSEAVLDRLWLSYEEAEARLAYDSEKRLLVLANKMLESNHQ